MSSTNRLMIVGRLTPDDWVIFGNYHDVNFVKKSVDCRLIIGRPSPDASHMKKKRKAADRLPKLLTSMLRQKKSAAVQLELVPTSPRFSQYLLIYILATVVLGNVTVAPVYKRIWLSTVELMTLFRRQSSANSRAMEVYNWHRLGKEADWALCPWDVTDAGADVSLFPTTCWVLRLRQSWIQASEFHCTPMVVMNRISSFETNVVCL